MTFRISDLTPVYASVQPLLDASAYLRGTDLDSNLLELVNMRASQINGCALCLTLHQKELREHGEREDRLAVLSAWRDADDWFSDREQAALAWTEAVTTLASREVPDDVFAQARAQFTEQELADLTLAVVTINGYNRFNIAFRNTPVAFEINGSAVAAD